jgi:hypothetical protein
VLRAGSREGFTASNARATQTRTRPVVTPVLYLDVRVHEPGDDGEYIAEIHHGDGTNSSTAVPPNSTGVGVFVAQHILRWLKRR